MTGLGWRQLTKTRDRLSRQPVSPRVSPGEETHHLNSIAHAPGTGEAVSLPAVGAFVAGAAWGLAVGLLVAGVLR